MAGSLCIGFVGAREVVLSPHARQMMDSRQVTAGELLDVLKNYSVKRESSYHRGKYKPDTYLFQRGLLSAVVCISDHEYFVKTVLLAIQERWTDEDAARRPRT